MNCQDKLVNFTTCDSLYDKLHECNAQFVNHAMQSSNPFTVCTDKNAFIGYRQAMEYFDKLFTTNDPQAKPGVTCSEKRINKNRMNVITSVVGSSKNLWESANCDECYAVVSPTDMTYSNATVDFLTQHELVTDCILAKAKINNTAVCTECVGDYQKLNAIYDSIKGQTLNKICFDLEDKVGLTMDH